MSVPSALEGGQREVCGNARATAPMPCPPFAAASQHADVAVLVVTHNSSAEVDELLDSLRAEAKDVRLRVVVADNASHDDTLARVGRHEGVIAFSTGGNLGYAAAINLAAARAGDAESLLVLNPDLTVAPGTILAMRRRLDGPGVGAVAPRMIGDDGEVSLSLRREPSVLRTMGDACLGALAPRRPGWLSEMDHDRGSYQNAHPIDWATGAALMYRADLSKLVGDWDERFFLYSEEVDFMRRIRETGAEVWFEPDAVVHHSGGRSGGPSSLAALMTVNRVRYMHKHHSRAQTEAVRWVLVVGELLRVRRKQSRATLMCLLSRRSWERLPRAELVQTEPDVQTFPAGSVIIPAHNEEAVIARALRPLAVLAQASRIQVVVVCNGCTDRTADIARSFAGVTVLEIPQASKVAALNRGESQVDLWPRLYLDADVELSMRTLRDLFLEMLHDGLVAARPPFIYDFAESSALVRGYYRARSRIATSQKGLWGAGAYALSQTGRSRFDVFPAVTSDDMFVDGLFRDDDKVVVDSPPVVVRAPRDLGGLLSVLRRTYRGPRELAASHPATVGDGTTGGTLRALGRTVRGPLTALDAGTYVLLALVGRASLRKPSSGGWERDDTSRR